MTRLELIAQINRMLNKPEVESAIPDFITLCEAELRRRLKTRQVVYRQPFTISGNTGFPCCASEILSVQIVFQETVRTLDYQVPEMIDEWAFQANAEPRFYTILNNRIHFLPYPDQPYSGHMTLRGTFDPLERDGDSNWISEMHPDVYLYGCLIHSAPYLEQDSRINMWQALFDKGVDQANTDQPMRQRNTVLRSDELTRMGGRRTAFNIYTGGYQ